MGLDLPNALSHAVYRRIEKQLQMIDTRTRLASQLDALEPEYRVIEGFFAHIGSADLRNRQQTDWHAVLTRRDLPANLRFDLTLPFNGGRVEMLDSFRQRIDRYVALVRSVEWLEKYRQANPASTIDIRFVDTISITPTFIETVRQTMEEEGRMALFRHIEPLLERSALVIVHESDTSIFNQTSEPTAWSRWIALPDRRMLMTDYSGRGALLWRGEELPTEPPITILDGIVMASPNHSRTMLVDENGIIIRDWPATD